MIATITPFNQSRRLTAFAGAGEPPQETRMMEMQPVSDRIPISAPNKARIKADSLTPAFR
jgi:hypothetical protein